jgi:hypothetical protein
MFDFRLHKPGQFRVKDVMLVEGTGYRHMCLLCHVVLLNIQAAANYESES